MRFKFSFCFRILTGLKVPLSPFFKMVLQFQSQNISFSKLMKLTQYLKEFLVLQFAIDKKEGQLGKVIVVVRSRSFQTAQTWKEGKSRKWSLTYWLLIKGFSPCRQIIYDGANDCTMLLSGLLSPFQAYHFVIKFPTEKMQGPGPITNLCKCTHFLYFLQENGSSVQQFCNSPNYQQLPITKAILPVCAVILQYFQPVQSSSTLEYREPRQSFTQASMSCLDDV